MLARRFGVCVGLAATLASCSFAGPDEPIAQTRAAILAGRPSGDDENANVFIETVGDDAALRCSGRIVAPGLVVSTRHCFLKRKSTSVLCTADGAPVDLSDTTDLSPEPPERITVYVGSNKAALRAVAVREVITVLEVTICRSDMAFLVLAEPGLDVRAPLRRPPVKVAEKLAVSGWGYTSDDATSLPNIRYTREQIPVSEVGPGFIPAGTLAIGGNTLCYGDSGAAALIDGAIVGTYSRLDGSTDCSLEQTRNIFAGIWAEEQLVKSAYAAIGEVPWYAGEQPPWLAGPSADAGVASAGEPASCSAARRVHGAQNRSSSWGSAALLVCWLLRRRKRSDCPGCDPVVFQSDWRRDQRQAGSRSVRSRSSRRAWGPTIPMIPPVRRTAVSVGQPRVARTPRATRVARAAEAGRTVQGAEAAQAVPLEMLRRLPTPRWTYMAPATLRRSRRSTPPKRGPRSTRGP